MQALITIVIAIALVLLVAKTLLHLLPVVLAGCLIALAAKTLPRVISHIRKERYFASEKFLAHNAKIASVVAEHNEVAKYFSEIRSDHSGGRSGSKCTRSRRRCDKNQMLQLSAHTAGTGQREYLRMRTMQPEAATQNGISAAASFVVEALRKTERRHER